jgi:hypothetical protein
VPRLPRFAGVLVAAAALTGCASVPTSGTVQVGRAVPAVAGQGNDNIRAFPAGPLPGETPTGIVTQFLDAMIDSDSNYGVARSFLLPGTTWNAGADTTLYDENSEVVTRESAHQVDVSMNRVATIDPRGAYQPAPGPIVLPFRVVHRLGQWRITHLSPGVLLSTSDALRSLRPADLYYFNLAQTHLVPVPIVVPLDQPGLATTLLRALLDKPSGGIAASVVTAAPEGLALLGNVPIDTDGVAEVNLSGELQQAAPAALQRLSAQIVATLRQVPGVRAVRLLDNGTPVTDIGVPPVQKVDSWRRFDPDAPPTSNGALASTHGVVKGIGRAAPDALRGRRLSAPIVSADGASVAALRRHAGRTSLLVGSTIGVAHPRLTARQLSTPTFTPSGAVFVVRGVGAQARLVDVPATGRPRRVAVPAELRGVGISAVAVSRDGSRIALVVGPPGLRSLVDGGLSSSHGAPAVSTVSLLVPADRDVRGVAWGAANQLVTTGRRSGRDRGVMVTTVDGYRAHFVSDVGLPRDVVQVAAAPGQPVLAADHRGVWARVGDRWHRVSTGRDPSYAG